jgi:hypothetical protein
MASGRLQNTRIKIYVSEVLHVVTILWRYVYALYNRKTERKKALRRPGHRWQVILRLVLRK